MTKRPNPFNTLRTWYIYAEGEETQIEARSAEAAKATFRKMKNLKQFHGFISAEPRK